METEKLNTLERQAVEATGKSDPVIPKSNAEKPRGRGRPPKTEASAKSPDQPKIATPPPVQPIPTKVLMQPLVAAYSATCVQVAKHSKAAMSVEEQGSLVDAASVCIDLYCAPYMAKYGPVTVLGVIMANHLRRVVALRKLVTMGEIPSDVEKPVDGRDKTVQPAPTPVPQPRNEPAPPPMN